jgi:hypothetical protein
MRAFSRIIVLTMILLSGCASPGEPVKGPPVFGTNEALEAELAAVNSEISQADSLISGARARIKQYQAKKEKGAESAIIGAEAEIYNNEFHKMTLLKRKRQLEAQIKLQR